MITQTPADLVCTGSQQQIETSTAAGTYVVVLADPDNSGPVRVGDVNTSADRGFPLFPGASRTYPISGAEAFEVYRLDKLYVFGAADDVLYVEYGVGGIN